MPKPRPSSNKPKGYAVAILCKECSGTMTRTNCGKMDMYKCRDTACKGFTFLPAP